MKKKQMKVLIIAYYYSPINSGGTVRPLKMAKYLRDFGWEVTVLTHTYDWVEPRVADGIIRIRDTSNNKNRKGIRGVIWLVLRLYTELLNRVGRYHSIYSWWKKRVIKNSRRIMDEVKPDVIIATYPPVETLEIGIHLSQTYQIPLICDFRDGILFEPIERPRMEKYPCIKKRYQEIEQAAVNAAEAVITIADPITDYFKSHYHVNHVKAETIASGFDPEDFRDVPVPATFGPSQFHIVFTGRFGLADGSNRVEFFFEALRLMITRDEKLCEKLRVHLVGDFMRSDLEPIKDLMDIGVVINHGLVSRKKSLGFQKIADLLLIITLPDRTCSVSTKIYEYLYTRKPILALTYGTVLAEMVEKTRTGWNVHPQQPEAISRLLERIVSDRKFYNSLQPDLEEVNKYSFVFQIEKLDSLIRSFGGVGTFFQKGPDPPEATMDKKIIAVHQPNFIPWLGFFYKWASAGHMVFLDDAAFTKGSHINRVRVRGGDASNQHWLTIPVHQKGRLNQPIAEVEIKNDLPWREGVLGKIRSCYGKARFFKQYFPGFEAIVMKERLLLADLNIELLQWLAGILAIETPWVLSSSLEGVNGKATDRLVSICRCLGATAYLSGFGGQKYQEEEVFKEHNIQLAVYDFKHPEYPQRGEGFIAGLSVMDLLFNCGPESAGILKKNSCLTTVT